MEKSASRDAEHESTTSMDILRRRIEGLQRLVERLAESAQLDRSEWLDDAPSASTSVRGGGKTHRENVLRKYSLKNEGYSLSELAEITGVAREILQEVYNRGIGAYKTNPTSVRMKGSFKKGINAPMSQKLSKEQWAMARVYSFLDGNPKHDTDLRIKRERHSGSGKGKGKGKATKEEEEKGELVHRRHSALFSVRGGDASASTSDSSSFQDLINTITSHTPTGHTSKEDDSDENMIHLQDKDGHVLQPVTRPGKVRVIPTYWLEQMFGVSVPLLRRTVASTPVESTIGSTGAAHTKHNVRVLPLRMDSSSVPKELQRRAVAATPSFAGRSPVPVPPAWPPTASAARDPEGWSWVTVGIDDDGNCFYNSILAMVKGNTYLGADAARRRQMADDLRDDLCSTFTPDVFRGVQLRSWDSDDKVPAFESAAKRMCTTRKWAHEEQIRHTMRRLGIQVIFVDLNLLGSKDSGLHCMIPHEDGHLFTSFQRKNPGLSPRQPIALVFWYNHTHFEAVLRVRWKRPLLVPQALSPTEAVFMDWSEVAESRGFLTPPEVPSSSTVVFKEGSKSQSQSHSQSKSDAFWWNVFAKQYHRVCKGMALRPLSAEVISAVGGASAIVGGGRRIEREEDRGSERLRLLRRGGLADTSIARAKKSVRFADELDLRRASRASLARPDSALYPSARGGGRHESAESTGIGGAAAGGGGRRSAGSAASDPIVLPSSDAIRLRRPALHHASLESRPGFSSVPSSFRSHGEFRAPPRPPVGSAAASDPDFDREFRSVWDDIRELDHRLGLR